MRLHRFYTKEPLTEALTYTNTDHIHQWRTVFRYTKGDAVILFGDGYEHVYTLEHIDKKEALLHEGERSESLLQERELCVALALIKKDNFELALQKCTELGVTHFVPIVSERSIQKAFDKERLQKILIEATEQSGWGRVPTLGVTSALREYSSEHKDSLLFLESTGEPAGEALQKKTIYVIGPEGGWTEQEKEYMRGLGVRVVSLGKGTLRAETAAISAAAIGLFV